MTILMGEENNGALEEWVACNGLDNDTADQNDQRTQLLSRKVRDLTLKSK